MPDILARYGPFFLYSYTVLLGTGAALALGLTALLARRAGMTGRVDGVLAAAAAFSMGLKSAATCSSVIPD